MKLFLNIIFFLFCVFVQAQKKHYFLIDSETKVKKKVKDSASAVKFLDSLAQSNYFFTELKDVKIKGDSTEIFFDKGKNFNETFVTLSDSIVKKHKLERDFFTKNLDSTKKVVNKKFIDDGFAFSRIKSKYKGQKNGYPIVELDINKNDKRTINGFVVKGYSRVPKRFMKNLEKDKIVVRQFKDGSSNFWCDGVHYNLNENGDLVFCSGGIDTEERREYMISYIKRNKKRFILRQPSILENEPKEYLEKIGNGKYAHLSVSEVFLQDKQYLKWMLDKYNFSSAQEKLKQQITEILK